MDLEAEKMRWGCNLIYSFLLLFYLMSMQTILYAQDELEAMHIIDWHVHVAGLGYGNSGAFINQHMRNNFRYYFFMKWMGVTEEELKTQGDQYQIKKLHEKLADSKYIDQAVVLALDGIIDQKTGELDRSNTQIYVPNDYVYSETARYRRLLFGASINPYRKDAIARLDQVVSQGAVLIKWIPSIMWIDPADPAIIPFYQRMAQHKIPLLTHTGMEKSFTTARDEYSDPLRLSLPLQQGVTVIAAHISTTGKSEGQDNFERILPMFDQYPNLYTDISSLTQINKRGYLVRALQIKGLGNRMIYGTDWPLQYFPIVSPWYHVNHIGIITAWHTGNIKNAWDRDIKLKQAMGVPVEVFTRRPVETIQ